VVLVSASTVLRKCALTAPTDLISIKGSAPWAGLTMGKMAPAKTALTVLTARPNSKGSVPAPMAHLRIRGIGFRVVLTTCRIGQMDQAAQMALIDPMHPTAPRSSGALTVLVAPAARPSSRYSVPVPTVLTGLLLTRGVLCKNWVLSMMGLTRFPRMVQIMCTQMARMARRSKGSDLRAKAHLHSRCSINRIAAPHKARANGVDRRLINKDGVDHHHSRGNDICDPFVRYQ
jgi:hypothetical protein